MTEAAEYGLMLWDGKTKGTVNNVVNLSRDHKPVVVYVAPTRQFRELITRQEIAARLWDQDVFVEIEAAVNTVIWKLRSALRDSPESPRFIETVPGKGYRFTAPVEIVSGVESSALGSEEGASRSSEVVAQPAVPQIVYPQSADNAQASPGDALVSPSSQRAEPWRTSRATCQLSPGPRRVHRRCRLARRAVASPHHDHCGAALRESQ